MSRPGLTIVIACYEMARELPRTIRSLCPPYQRGCAAGEVEIIVVDNGSAVPPGPEIRAGIDADIRILQCPHPGPSPVRAINQGIAEARGDLVGVWIDGARLASPGLVAASQAAAALHPRPVIATINYQLGPALQYISAERGYDRAEEDRLLASIGWPEHGERLFEIATCELRHGEAGPMLESNGLFLPRALWAELGGYDEAFDGPGGGVANPDVLTRACALPDTQLIRLIGEGTFHQYHGGISTSTARGAAEMLQRSSRHYLRLRGKPLTPVREVGWLFDASAGQVVDRTPIAEDARC